MFKTYASETVWYVCPVCDNEFSLSESEGDICEICGVKMIEI